MIISYRKISIVIIITISSIWLLSGIYVVENNEEGLNQRYGKLIQERIPPGIHYHLPCPFEQITKLPVRKTERITIGFKPTKIDTVPAITKRLTGDVNIINLVATLQYSIKGAANYLFSTKDPVTLLKFSSEAAITKVLSSMSVDYALTIGKVDVQNKIRGVTQKIMDDYGTGIQILNVNLQEISPPKEVSAAFRDVINAQSDAQRFINQAYGEKNATILNAEAQANELKKSAESYRQGKINRTLGETDRFLNVLAKYKTAPEINRKRMYLELIEAIAPGIKKIIVSSKLDTNLIKIYGIEEGSNPLQPKSE